MEKYGEKDLLCPECQMPALDYQYVGDPNTRVGYALFWCNHCLHCLHLSRVLIPDHVSFLSFEDDEQKIAERIPKRFHLIN